MTVNELKGNVYKLSPKGKKKKTILVGEQCLVSVALDGNGHEILCDTGAQVSLMGSQWVRTNFLEKQIRQVSELFDKQLMIRFASGDCLHFEGWVGVDMKAPN